MSSTGTTPSVQAVAAPFNHQKSRPLAVFQDLLCAAPVPELLDSTRGAIVQPDVSPGKPRLHYLFY